MKVEPAKVSELTLVVKLCQRLHAESSWARIPFSPARMRKSLKVLMRKPDFTILVAKNKGGEMRGILIGSVDCPLYSRTHFTTDLEFACEQGGDELLDAFKDWSVSVGSKMIVMTDSNGGRGAAKERFFRRHGFEKVGDTYQLWLP